MAAHPGGPAAGRAAARTSVPVAHVAVQAPDRIVSTLYGLVALIGLTVRAPRATRRPPTCGPRGPFVRHRLSLLPLLLAAVLAFGLPATANAGYKDVYKDCTDGNIDGSYSARELQEALDNQEANLGDYSECSDAIYRKQTEGAKGGSGTSNGGGGGSTPSGTPGGGGTPGTPGAGTTGAGAGNTAGAGTTGTTAGGTNGSDPDAAVPADDARNADLAEKNAALVAATQAAEREAGARAADLKDTAVPAAALELGSSNTDLPLPLLLTLVACVAAACIAGGTSGLQALRRRRGR